MDFSSEGLHRWLDAAADHELDSLNFGVIALDAAGLTCRYSEFEARLAGLQKVDVLGRPFFSQIARCMNNGIVAGRFADARLNGTSLDVTIAYVLAFRIKSVPARLRLLSSPGISLDYLLVLPATSTDDRRG